MFKRSLASFAAIAVASGAVVAPANAVTVTVNDDTTCTIELTDEEAKLTGSKPPANLSKAKAAHLKATLLDKQLPALGAEIEKDKQELDKPGLGEEKKATLKSALEEKEKRFIANNNLKKALEACIDGKSYDSNQSDDSKQPGGSDKPGGPNKPGDGHTSSSIDGAGIGVIVAVLGILAAALSFIKPLLPAQLRALLP
ncbi:TPA: hypothetical protein I8V37_001801 [Corynebacterium striatum]|uniref:hypothetical protein n=1 Tax=Corynebacterium striatum TaxID=43770 RepID=UPI001A26C242|nr:hypothetical protein [Corynebacterium striatum]HAT1176082.1 hypothetical protein [Corynebacterium striatum]HAT1184107.1 hypothetical protein [Corynebacterium striatum]HAT1262930.1 hypothetical protein [Corynebacterium striatum]HAT1329050.1 hypothetical protein [Corynebacterium striatum]